jgi:dTDP-4-amino-4,6-dideoxygalactose transaminase
VLPIGRKRQIKCLDQTQSFLEESGVEYSSEGSPQLAVCCGIFVVEDAAQAVMSTYYGPTWALWGTLGVSAFMSESKNCTMGEGGALLINEASCNNAAEFVWGEGHQSLAVSFWTH